VPLLIKTKLMCPNCGYKTTKIVGDANFIELHLTKCPKCKEYKMNIVEQKREDNNFLNNILDKIFKE